MRSLLKWIIGIVIFILWFVIPLVGLSILDKLFIMYNFSLFIISERLLFAITVVLWLSLIFTIYLKIPNWWVQRNKEIT